MFYQFILVTFVTFALIMCKTIFYFRLHDNNKETQPHALGKLSNDESKVQEIHTPYEQGHTNNCHHVPLEQSFQNLDKIQVNSARNCDLTKRFDRSRAVPGNSPCVLKILQSGNCSEITFQLVPNSVNTKDLNGKYEYSILTHETNSIDSIELAETQNKFDSLLGNQSENIVKTHLLNEENLSDPLAHCNNCETHVQPENSRADLFCNSDVTQFSQGSNSNSPYPNINENSNSLRNQQGLPYIF